MFSEKKKLGLKKTIASVREGHKAELEAQLRRASQCREMPEVCVVGRRGPGGRDVRTDNGSAGPQREAAFVTTAKQW